MYIVFEAVPLEDKVASRDRKAQRKLAALKNTIPFKSTPTRSLTLSNALPQRPTYPPPRRRREQTDPMVSGRIDLEAKHKLNTDLASPTTDQSSSDKDSTKRTLRLKLFSGQTSPTIRIQHRTRLPKLRFPLLLPRLLSLSRQLPPYP